MKMINTSATKHPKRKFRGHSKRTSNPPQVRALSPARESLAALLATLERRLCAEVAVK